MTDPSELRGSRDPGAAPGSEGARAAGSPTCLNCDALLHGPYCAQCGQRSQELRVPFWHLAGDAFRDVFQWDSRLARTLRHLVSSPGFLSREYWAGHRARYVPPLRLFLVISVVFIFLVSSFGQGIRVVVSLPDGAQPQGPGSGAAVQVSGSVDFLGPLSPLVDQGMEVAREDPDRVRGLFFQAWSWVMFLVMPLFALLTWVLFRRSGAYFAEHLVFAVHFHAYQFLALSVALLLGIVLEGWYFMGVVGLAVASIPIYLLAALGRAYGEPLWKTLPKGLILGGAYVVALGAFSAVATFITLIAVA